MAMEVSRTSMKAARATVMAMSQGLTLGFHGAEALRFGLSTCLAAGAAAAEEGAAGCNSDKRGLLKCLLPLLVIRLATQVAGEALES